MPAARLSFRYFASLTLLMLAAAPAFALKVSELKSGQTYRVDRIVISGNHALSGSELKSQMKTKERPFYLLWRKRPTFDTDVFREDLKRLSLLYRSHGYFQTRIDYDLKLHDELVTADIHVTENRPTHIQQVKILVNQRHLPRSLPLYSKLKVKPGEVFNDSGYQSSQEVIRDYYRNHGFAHVTTQRWAEVNLSVEAVRIWYFVQPGVKGVFGRTTVSGNRHVASYIITRELAYTAGQPFSQKPLDQTRDRLLKLGLFSVVRLTPQLDVRNPQVVPIRVVVRERPKHSIDIAGGYNTQSQFIGNLSWRDMNFMGGGRQLTATLRYSNIDSYARLILTQPYLFDRPELTGILNFGEDIQQVPPYTLFGTRFLPSIRYSFSEKTKAFIGYRLEYDKLSSVDSQVPLLLGPIKMSGVLSGPEAGFTTDTTDDLFNPTRGYVVDLEAMQAGEIFGGSYNFYRFWGQIKHYHLLGWQTVLATRLKMGTGDSFGSRDNYPLFYRFFIGGEGSVRGWRYWRLGPHTPDNTPIGGLTDLEGSLELRRPLWRELSGAVFLDFGQLSTHPYDLPFRSLDFSAGPALAYNTPVGPIRVDLGIPFFKPRGQTQWQIYFSIGQYF